MTQLSAFDDQPALTFEDFKNENGDVYWWASDLARMVGYKDVPSFEKVLDKATKAMISLGIPHYKNIVVSEREIDGVKTKDFKLTRFACYLAVMNGNPQKPEVAAAQVYFAQQTRQFELHVQGQNEMDRLLIRDELSEGNKVLSSTAKRAGADDFARFQDAGYMGLYNMQVWQLKNRRGLDKSAKLADYMGRTELAANLFRVTQTEERIRNKGVRGQAALEATHHDVGREVRDIVKRNTGNAPENLPQEKQLPEVRKELKKGYSKMLKADAKKRPKKK